jgi:hypothetical protein
MGPTSVKHRNLRVPAILLCGIGLALGLGAAACGEDSRHELSVDVRTDATPGGDFDRALVEVGTASLATSTPRATATFEATPAGAFARGVRVAEFESLPAHEYFVRTSLKKGEVLVAQETRVVDLDRDFGLVVVFSKACLGVLCAELDTCVDGECRGAGQDAGNCNADEDCRALLGGACGDVACAGGTCLCTCSLDDGGACSSEDCQNGEDDDGDSLSDCEDPDCDRLACSDDDLCTVNDQCLGGACTAEPKDCAAPPGPCKTNACDPGTGECVLTAVADGTPCPAHPSRCCAGECADTSADEANCGGCGIACKDSYQCVSSGGQFVCDCSDAAPSNTQCPTGQVCSVEHKVCACKPGTCPPGQSCTARSGADYCSYP